MARCSYSRLLAQRGIAGQLRDALAARLRTMRVGPASDPPWEMGPVIDQANVRRVDRPVEEAIAACARPVLRSGPATDSTLAQGAFYRPTLLEVADNALPIMQQEVLGPVLTLQSFDTEAEAIQLANGMEHDLAASVWSRMPTGRFASRWRWTRAPSGSTAGRRCPTSSRWRVQAERPGQDAGLGRAGRFSGVQHVAFVPAAGERAG